MEGNLTIFLLANGTSHVGVARTSTCFLLLMRMIEDESGKYTRSENASYMLTYLTILFEL